MDISINAPRGLTYQAVATAIWHLCHGIHQVHRDGQYLDIFVPDSIESLRSHLDQRVKYKTKWPFDPCTLFIVHDSWYRDELVQLTRQCPHNVYIHVFDDDTFMYELAQRAIDTITSVPQPHVFFHTSNNNYPLIDRWNIEVDVDRLREVIMPYTVNRSQVCLNSSDGKSLEEGAGSAFNIEQERGRSRLLNDVFKNTYVEQVYNSLREICDFGRARAMTVAPKSNYSFHTDITRRLHIPLTTNEQSFLVVGGQRVYVPKDGHPYEINTRIPHNAVNGHSSMPRTHLVFALIH
jgi:Aspartyl/Asparaginyl beta-hydroxylase